jgi:hypothetical protein
MIGTIMSETITTTELKTLIQEIVKETITSSDYFANSRKAEELIQSLIAKGAKPNRRFREYISNLRYQAKMADRDEIAKEVEGTLFDRRKKSKRIRGLDEPELSSINAPPVKPPMDYGPEDWKRWEKEERKQRTDAYKEPSGKMSPALRAKYSASAKAHFAKRREQGFKR